MSRGWKRFWVAAGILFALVLVLAIRGVMEARSLGFLRTPVFETVPPDVPAMGRPAVLVFSKTNSFIHKEAIPAAKLLLREIANVQGWEIYLSDSGAVFNPQDLAKFDVVVWNNVTGDVLTTEQRGAMRAWLENGGGFVGLHAAGDNSHDGWPWYQDTVIRAHFIGHPVDPQFQQATLMVEQPADPIVADLPVPWVRVDEWYSFDSSPRAPGVQILLIIDEDSYAPGSFFGTDLSMGEDHPMMWKHCVGAGRVFYSAPGHTGETYSEPEYAEVLRRAISWAGALEEGAPEEAGCPIP